MADALYIDKDKDKETEHDMDDIKPTPTEEQMSDFKQQLQSWIELNKKIALLRTALKERLTIQKTLEPSIQSFMDKYGYDNISTQDGSIRLAKRKVKTVIKLKDIKKRIGEHYGEEALKVFEEGRILTQMQHLRMIMPKPSINLKI